MRRLYIFGHGDNRGANPFTDRHLHLGFTSVSSQTVSSNSPRYKSSHLTNIGEAPFNINGYKYDNAYAQGVAMNTTAFYYAPNLLKAAIFSSFVLISSNAEASSSCITTAINLPSNYPQLPEGVAPINHFRDLMFLTKEVMDYLDENCSSDPEYRPARNQFQQIYSDSQRSCEGMASDEAICTPRMYPR